MPILQGANTYSSRRIVIKRTKANMKRWQQDLIDLNRSNKRSGIPKLTLDEYINRVHGIVDKPKKVETYKPTISYAQQRTAEDKNKYKSVVSTLPICNEKVDNREKLKISSQYTVGISYNKGGYMLIPDNEVTSIGRK